jgi:hypothetical protein
MEAHRIIAESRPMLEEFLREAGLLPYGQAPDFAALLEPLSDWVDVQRVPESLRFYLAARLAAFICEYLIELGAGERVIEDGRILMRAPIRGLVQREFDPYAVAISMATNRHSLKMFLQELCC